MTKEERISRLRQDISYKAPEMWKEVFEDFYDGIQEDILSALESYLYDVFNSPSQIKRCMNKIKEVL